MCTFTVTCVCSHSSLTWCGRTLFIYRRVLISAGANVNLRDVNGRTPLHYAAEHNASKVISVLIEDGLAFIDAPEQENLQHSGDRYVRQLWVSRGIAHYICLFFFNEH